MDSQKIESNSNPPPSAPPMESTTTTTTSSSLYPSVDTSDLVEKHLLNDAAGADSNPKDQPAEETILRVPGVILHLIDPKCSVELASGDFSVIRILQGEGVVALLARVGDLQWPLARDEATVKLDESHYFFSLRVPGTSEKSPEMLNYGLTVASKGQEGLLAELDRILESSSSFSVQKVSEKAEAEADALDGSVAGEVMAAEMVEGGQKKEMMEEMSAAYWTTLAPNVEEYSGCVAKAIALSSGQLVRGILWCGDVTVDRIKWGNEILRKRMKSNGAPAEISPTTLKRIERVNRVTSMSERLATGILCGVVKFSGYITGSLINSKAGKKFFGLLPGEIVLATLDGFGKICDAVEVAGKNVLSTSSEATTKLVSHRYGEEAAKATCKGLDAAGHAVGTAWAVFKIRKAFNPKSSIQPTTFARSAAKAAAGDLRAKMAK